MDKKTKDVYEVENGENAYTKLFNRNELRRLEKAAREKNKKHLLEWAKQFDDQVRKEYEHAFQQELGDAIENFFLAIAYSLRFSEKTKFGRKRINEFLDDLLITIDLFRTRRIYTR